MAHAPRPLTSATGTIDAVPNKPRERNISDAERQAITKAIQAGETREAIAERYGRSEDSVGRIAAAIGHRWGKKNMEAAHSARAAYAAERRAMIASRLTDEAETIQSEFDQPYLVYNFGGKDNDYNEHEFDRMPLDAKRTAVATVSQAMRTVIDIDKHDNASDEGMAAVDQWLRSLLSGSSE